MSFPAMPLPPPPPHDPLADLHYMRDVVRNLPPAPPRRYVAVHDRHDVNRLQAMLPADPQASHGIQGTIGRITGIDVHVDPDCPSGVAEIRDDAGEVVDRFLLP